MSSRSDMSDWQEMTSSGSTFRNNENVDVVEQMYDATEQMGNDMPVGLGGILSTNE